MGFQLFILSGALIFYSTGFARTTQSISTLDSLKNGNARFVSGKVRHDGSSIQDVKRLSEGQKPRSVVLSCSDSRVAPELILDQKLGEIFTVRTAGETLAAPSIASIEYAIEHLGSELIVVMGHTKCGAVKAALDSMDGKSVGSENLDLLVADIHPRLKGKVNLQKPSADLKEESWLNTRGVAQDLLKRSKIIAKAVQSGKVRIQVALYNIATGVVEFE